MGNLISKKVQMSPLYKRSNAIINNHHKKDDNGGYGKLFHSVVKENKSILSEDLVHLDHHIIRELWKSNFSSPVGDLLKDSNAKVLDVGCGLGAWLCEISTSYPKSEFIGVDALPIFPTIKPYNVKFIQRNVLDGLPFENNTFDFVHIRGLVYDFTESQWINDVYKELLRVLKPGGWLEICEAETKAYNAGPLSDILYTAIYKDATSENVNPLICEAHKSNLHAVLRNNNYDSDEEIVIYHEKKLCPIGRWSGKIGETAALYIVGSLKNYFINIKEKNVLKLYKSYINANSSDASSIGSDSHRSSNKKELKASDELIEILLDEYDVYKTYYFYHRFYYQKKL